MRLFKRKQESLENVPDEIKDYYDAERRERRGVAWLLAGITLIVTVLLATGIFFGGRWAYRTITDDGSSPDTDIAQVEEAAPSPVSETETAQPPAETSPPQQTTPQPSTPTPAPTSSTPPQTSSANTEDDLPNTGPGNVLLIITAVSVTAGLLHHFATRKRLGQH